MRQIWWPTGRIYSAWWLDKIRRDFSICSLSKAVRAAKLVGCGVGLPPDFVSAASGWKALACPNGKRVGKYRGAQGQRGRGAEVQRCRVADVRRYRGEWQRGRGAEVCRCRGVEVQK